ncbi:MAG: SufD family Fe-S cluster assembly protein [Chloroflexi bacterium]|nr:SufD family Fe-S cluster assembly protein [Chloroflexota bacterium]
MTTELPRLSVPEAYQYGWHDSDARYANPKKKGLTEEVIRDISQTYKNEPDWMFQRRLKAYRHYRSRPMPTWGADLSGIDFEDIFYYLQASNKSEKSWEDVPDYVKRTFDKLGIPAAEQKYLAGVSAQYDSLHSAVVEIIVKEGADVRYTTIQNWSHNVYNLVTKRSVVQKDGRMTWIDANLGSKVTMKYPSVYLVGERAHGEVLSVAFAGDAQTQDAGAKMVHAAPNTTSIITSKGISRGTGKQNYRGLVKIYPGAHGAKSTVRCDALMLDDTAQSQTFPVMEVEEDDVTIGHEASVSKVGEEQLFYLMSRGLSENDATAMVVNGFIEPIVKTLPMDYAIEMNRLIQLQMAGAIG